MGSVVSLGLRFEREIPVRHDVDVFVAGGGPAGAAAAVMAAREGARVFLAERQACFGGMGTAALVPAFMTFGDRVHFLAGGFGEELLERLEAVKGCWPVPFPRDGCCCLGIRAEALKRIYDAMVQESGARFSFETQIIGIESQGGTVTHAVCAAKSGLFAVRAQLFVDATGDGDIAAWAGAPFEKGDAAAGAMMPGTLCSLWSGIDWAKVGRSQLSPQAELERAISEGAFTVADRHMPGIWRCGEELGGGNIGHEFGVDATDETSVTQAMIHGRRLVLEYERFYKKYMKGYERMELVATGSTVGIRETRRIMGDYVLTMDDYKKRASFDDEIGRYSYPIDVHASGPDDVSYQAFLDDYYSLRYSPGESYGIPYRILTPRGLDNVLVAGRCVSTDRPMQGSIRVMPGCYIMGQAAGIAAAMAAAVKCGTRGVSVAQLRERLRARGAYLPDASGS